MVFHDPVDWYADLQVLLDVLAGGEPLGSGRAQSVPLFASNPDIVYADKYPAPRLAQRAFLLSADAIWRDIHGVGLQWTQFGKPTETTARYAERMLFGVGGPLDEIWMVGDNPRADVALAENAGGEWRSVLVRTGGFSGPGNDPGHPADVVCEDVGEAVEAILSGVN